MCYLPHRVLTHFPSTLGVLGIGLPDDASAYGWHIDDALTFSQVTDLTLLVLVLLALGWGAFRYGRRHAALYDRGERPWQKWRTVLLVATVVVAIEGRQLYASETGLREIFWNWSIPLSNPDTVRIEVNARQWAWDIRYPGGDGKFATASNASPDDIVLWNEIWVPVDTPVHVQLSSTDVIHGFSLPNFRLKGDAMPGRVNQLWFQAKELGVFELSCAQHCGTSHYKMRGQVHVVPKAEFREWQRRLGRLAELGFDEADVNARWGWEWK